MGWTFSFVFLPASLPSLVIGVLAGVSRLLTGTVLAILARVGATVLVVALGVWISGLGSFASFSLYEEPVVLGEYLGILAGMEAALAVSWGAAKLVVRARRVGRRRG